MVRQGTSTGSPRPPARLVWQLSVAATVAAAIAAVSLVSASARTVVAAICVVAVVTVTAACAEVMRRGRTVARLRRTVAEQDEAIARQAAETTRLTGDLLPQVVEQLRKGEFPEDVLSSIDAPAEHRAVLRSVVEAVSAEEDLRESAQRAFVNIARRVQAIVHQQAQELREMEDRHGRNPSVFGDLLRIDHGTALIGRLADSIAVLGGARPGRQWSRAVPLYSVLRGAMSRILDYQRVELHSVSEVAVVGTAVEPLIHALSELLDNATRYSPPQTKVHLTAVDVQSGIAIEIEDGGVSMSEEARLRAERMLRQAQQGIDVNDLGETPRLGLAVVGRLAQAYGFQVSLRSSAYGGVRAVLVVPQDLITTTSSATGLAHGIGTSSGPRAADSNTYERLPRPVTGPTASVPAAAAVPASAVPSASVPAAALAGDDVPVVTERTANGLPQRRRKTRATVPAAPETPAASAASAMTAGDGVPAASAASGPPSAASEDGAAAPVQPGMWLAAFQSGLSGDTTQPSKGNKQP